MDEATPALVNQRIALLGLGIMGQALGELLLEQGASLTVWNRTADKALALKERGADVAATPAKAAAGAHVLALCLTDATAVEQVLFAAGGAVEQLSADTVVLDFSTLGIAPTQKLAARVLARTKSQWIDAPVSGGPSGARSGTLAVFCGGDAQSIARVAPVLDAVSRHYTHMGPVGAGQATKLCNQLIVSTTMLAVAEAVAMAKAFGIDAGALPRALAGGYADSSPLQIFGPRMASQMLEPRISEIETMRKDVKALLEASAVTPVQLRLIKAVDALYDLAVQRGIGGADLGALATLSDS